MGIFDKDVAKAIPCEVHMISGSMDSQTSADVFNVGAFELPNPAGRSGGACTSALLKVLHKRALVSKEPYSWVDTLRRMREELSHKGYDQVPQLTSSRRIQVKKPMYIVPPDCQGKRRAVLIGINYVGQNGELSGCHNDVRNIKSYLMEKQGFAEGNITLLMDDGKHHRPTRKNILSALHRLAVDTTAGDVAFVHYSGRTMCGAIIDSIVPNPTNGRTPSSSFLLGHGGRVPDNDGDEEDGYDETLIPVDFRSAGMIRDDELLRKFVCQMPGGSNLTCLMDCCHSGTVLDLPYRFAADDADHKEEMYQDAGFHLDALIGLAVVGGVVAAVATSADLGAGADGCCDDCCEGLIGGMIGGLFGGEGG